MMRVFERLHYLYKKMPEHNLIVIRDSACTVFAITLRTLHTELSTRALILDCLGQE